MIVAIALVTEVGANKVVGYRLYETATRRYKDVYDTTLSQLLIRDSALINNLRLSKGKVVPLGLQRQKFPVVECGGTKTLTSAQSFAVTAKIGNIAYEVVDYNGRTAYLHTDEVIALINKVGTALNAVVELIPSGGQEVKGVGVGFDYYEPTPEQIAENAKYMAERQAQIAKNLQSHNERTKRIVDRDKNAKGFSEVSLQGMTMDSNAAEQAQDEEAGQLLTALLDKQAREERAKTDKAASEAMEASQAQGVLDAALSVISNPSPLAVNNGDDARKWVNAEGVRLDDRFARLMLLLAQISPVYYGLFVSMPRREVEDPNECSTMAVDSQYLYYYPPFVMGLTDPELLFITLHELLHVAFMHVSRRSPTADPRIMNIAEDFYINKYIVQEFNLSEDGRGVVGGYASVAQLKMPEYGCYTSAVSIEKDTVEGMYLELQKELEKTQQNKNNRNSKGLKGLKGAGGAGGGGTGNSDSDSNDSDDSEGAGGDTDADNEDNVQNGKKKGKGKSKGKGKDKAKIGPEEAVGSGEGNDAADIDVSCGTGGGVVDADGADDAAGEDEEELVFRGVKIKIGKTLAANDVRESTDSQRRAAKESENAMIMSKAITLARSAGMGGGVSPLQVLMESMLAPKIDWERVVSKLLVEYGRAECTFKEPDTRFIYQHPKFATAGFVKNKLDLLKRLKVCIDVSGSVFGSGELNMVYTHVKRLLMRYKAEAEVIFWTDVIVNKAEFKTFEDFKKVPILGTGCTDPSCLFKYFESRECKVKPSSIIIFTDGGFSLEPLAPYRKYKHTVWVMQNDTQVKNFDKPFGYVAQILPGSYI